MARHLERTSTKHRACARANCLLRVVRPSAAVNFAETHDRAVWQCLANILRTDLSECSGAVQDAATLPFTLRGLGLRKATRVSGPAHCASWADCLPMIHARHPLVATVLLHQLEGAAVTPCLREIAHGLVRGFEPPSWRDVVAGARPARNEVEEFEWGCGAGWQHEAGARGEAPQRLAHLPSSRRPSKGIVAMPMRAWEWFGFLH